MLTKEQKAFAIARNFDYIVIPLEEEEEDRLYINLYTSYNGLMGIVEIINTAEFELNKPNWSIEITRQCVIVKDDFYEQTCKYYHYERFGLTDALLDAVYYVLVESKELK